MYGTIERIRIFPTKGCAGIELAEARLIENSGIEGDFRAREGERQLSLLSAENREQLTGQKEKGLCFSRFRENISIRFTGPDPLMPGARLKAGEAALEISGETKHCHEECSLYRAGKPCPLAGLSLFAKVLKSGTLRPGDRILAS